MTLEESSARLAGPLAPPWFHRVVTSPHVERGEARLIPDPIDRIAMHVAGLPRPRPRLVTVLHPDTWAVVREAWASLAGYVDVGAEVRLRRDESMRWADDGGRE